MRIYDNRWLYTPVRAHDGPLVDMRLIQVDPERPKLVTANEKSIAVWEVPNLRLICSADNQNMASATYQSSQGYVIAAATRSSGGAVITWDLNDRGYREAFSLSATEAGAFALSTQGRRIAYCDAGGGKLWTWGREQQSIVLQGCRKTGSFAFSPDDNWIASPQGSDLVVWDMHGVERARISERLTFYCFAANNALILVREEGEKEGKEIVYYAFDGQSWTWGWSYKNRRNIDWIDCTNEELLAFLTDQGVMCITVKGQELSADVRLTHNRKLDRCLVVPTHKQIYVSDDEGTILVVSY